MKSTLLRIMLVLLVLALPNLLLAQRQQGEGIIKTDTIMKSPVDETSTYKKRLISDFMQPPKIPKEIPYHKNFLRLIEVQEILKMVRVTYPYLELKTTSDEEKVAAAPANDNCANAIALTVNAAPVNGTTDLAGQQTAEPISCATSVAGSATAARVQTVWYKFVATATTMDVALVSGAVDLANNLSCCYFSSAVYGPNVGCLPSSCNSLSCQSALRGPNNTDHVFSNLIVGATYLIQVVYVKAPGTPTAACGGLTPHCGVGTTFTVQVKTAGFPTFPSNPAAMSTCQSPSGPACDFPSPPTVATVTSTCPTYINPVNGPSITNEVVRACFTLATGLYNNAIQFQIIVQSTCTPGNVHWLQWFIYTNSCTLVTCGDLSNVNASGLQCQTPYKICYQYEISTNNGTTCFHSQFWPYVNSTGPVVCQPLPVELLKFSTRFVEDEGVHLIWTTASEQENEKFIIERMTTGEFEELVTLPGHGTTTTATSYETIDLKPRRGINYYRLKQVDYNGNFVYSSVSKVLVKNEEEFSFHPNPTNSVLEVNTDEEGEFRLVNVLGQVSFTTYLNKGENHVDVSSLTKGVYLGVFLTPEGISQKSKIILE